MNECGELAARLRQAITSAKAIDDSNADALASCNPYEVQSLFNHACLTTETRYIGYKIQILERSLWQKGTFGTPVSGRLTSAHLLAPEQPLASSEFIAPAVQPVLAFRLGKDVVGPGLSVADILEACSAVYGGLEVIDYRFSSKSLTTEEIVADNALAARFMLTGGSIDPKKFDLSVLGCTLFKSGQPIASAAGAAVMGHPAAAVAWLGNGNGDKRTLLKANSIILAGNLVEPTPMSAGDSFTGSFSRIGQVTLRVC